MQDAPKGLRLHIGFFGRCNVGKSSLLNALTGQPVSIVSDTPGTTTDPVEKTLEFASLGPVVFIDTAGLDDSGALGAQRMQKSAGMLSRMDMALLITDRHVWGDAEKMLLDRLRREDIPFLVVFNKADLPSEKALPAEVQQLNPIEVSSVTGEGLDQLRARLLELKPEESLHEVPLVSDLLPEKGWLMLVVPLDSGAPKGRLILPQVQTIRGALDGHQLCLVLAPEEIPQALTGLKEPPALVVCDSQIIHKVAEAVPQSIPLTTFSILMARSKGDLPLLAAGAAAIARLKAGDKVLMMEGCSHHAQHDDIGRVKIPRLLQKYAGGPLRIDINAGKASDDFSENYDLIVHCGGCTLTRRQMCSRLRAAQEHHIPMTNYGVALSFTQGVLERVLTPFPEALAACRAVLADN